MVPKTPVALSVMERLRSSGKAGLLEPGYGGKISVPTLVEKHRHTFRDVGMNPACANCTNLDRRRPRCRCPAATESGIDVLVMDDGLQNPTLHKDLSILVIDGKYGFGNNGVMPSGPLRNPWRKL